MIKTIFCDLGNVIVFFDNHKIAEGLAKYSNKDEKYIYKFFLESIARKGFDKGNISPTQFFMNFKNNLNLKIDFKRFKKLWCSCFLGLNKDMEKLLKKLKKNYKLVLLSNTDTIHFTYIKNKYKLLNIFDDYVLSYKLGYKKPNPLIYQYALKKTKVLPNEILYIDDILEFVKAAKFLGIKSVQYKNFEKLETDLKRMNVKI